MCYAKHTFDFVPPSSVGKKNYHNFKSDTEDES